MDREEIGWNGISKDHNRKVKKKIRSLAELVEGSKVRIHWIQ